MQNINEATRREIDGDSAQHTDLSEATVCEAIQFEALADDVPIEFEQMSLWSRDEAVAIFALTFTFYLYLKSIKTGSMFWSVCSSISYFYMVSSWGGYTFIINLIPIHALALLIINKYSANLYTAYSMFILNGTLLAMVLPVIGFNAVETSEHFSGFFVLALMNGVALVKYLKGTLTEAAYKKALRLFVTTSVVVMGVISLAVITFAMTSAALPNIWSMGVGGV